MVDIVLTVGLLCLLALPLALSVLALLDAARRPAWVWALAGRSQVVWIATILFGIILVPLGLVVASTYLIRVRPRLVATEGGQLEL